MDERKHELIEKLEYHWVDYELELSTHIEPFHHLSLEANFSVPKCKLQTLMYKKPNKFK